MSAIFKIAHDHPALAGHFLGNPIVPGVVILNYVFDAATDAGYRINAIGSAKFTNALPPEQPFTIELQPKGSRLLFEVRDNDKLFTQGSLSVEPAKV